MEQDRLQILKKVELGEITLEEASDLLSELETDEFAIQEQSQVIYNEQILNNKPSDSDKKEKPSVWLGASGRVC